MDAASRSITPRVSETPHDPRGPRAAHEPRSPLGADELHADDGVAAESPFQPPPNLGDEALADAIDRDVADRLVRGLPIPLSRYLDSMSDPSRRPLAIDAAVDGALRALAASGRSLAEAVDALASEHPALRRAIESTATISMLFGPSGAAHETFAHAVERSLPSRFGKTLPDGRGRYELVEALGARRPASVFRAVDHLLSRPGAEVEVVVKILGRAGDQSQLDEAIEEARLLRSLRHPSIVGLVDSGVSDDAEVYLVTEFVHGASLREFVEANGAPDPAEAARLVASLGHAIGMAHRVGVVHCDLSPSNIMVDAEGRGRIVDLGSAARVGTSAPAERAFRGTPGFMAPEQADPSSPAARTLDVYALGAVLFWLLTGTSANGRDSAEIEALLRGRENPRSRRLEALAAAHVPKSLTRLAMSAIDLDPVRRPPDADALGRRLDHWLEEDARARLPWRERVVAWARRRQTLTLLITIGVTAALTFSIVTWSLGPSSPPRRSAEYTLMTARLDRALSYALSRYDRSLRIDRDEARELLSRLPQVLGTSTASSEPVRQWMATPEGARLASLLAGLQIIAGRHGESAHIDAITLRTGLAALLLAQDRDPASALRGGEIERQLSRGDPLHSIAVAIRRGAAARAVTEGLRSGRMRSGLPSPENALVDLDASIREHDAADRHVIARLLQEQRDRLQAEMVERSSPRPASDGSPGGAVAPRQN